MQRSRLDILIKEYEENLPKNLDKIELEWRKVSAKDWSAPEWDSFYRLLHTNCGSSECYGYTRLSQQLRIVCNMVKRHVHTAPEAKEIEMIDSKIFGIMLKKSTLIVK